MNINLNTCTKEEFVDMLILSDDTTEFYTPREANLLALDFDLEEMKSEFETWLEQNSDNY